MSRAEFALGIALALMQETCPVCSSPVRSETLGGLFTRECGACGWHEAGTYSWELFPPISGGTVRLVAHARQPISAVVLKAVRESSRTASALAPADVSSALQAPSGLLLGDFPLYRADQLVNLFAKLGIDLERTQHEG